VEVEPDQGVRLVLNAAVHFVEILPESSLGALFIDQIDKGAVLVAFLYVLIVFLYAVGVQLIAWVDGHFRTPF
jgi:hypothetical protein